MPRSNGSIEGKSACPELTIIVPTLNEADNIDALIQGLLDAFAHTDQSIEILFADGGSSDGTQARVSAWEGMAPARLIAAESGRGLAGDVMVAAQHARAPIVLVMDADLSHAPADAPALVRPVIDGVADMAIGSRYIPGGSSPDWPWQRKLMSRAAALVAWPLVDVNDPTSGFFAITRDRLLAVDADATGFKIGLEAMLAGEDDLRIVEKPITFRDRTHGSSKMSMNQVTSYFQRLGHLAGGGVSTSNAGRFALVGLFGLGVDLGVFEVLWSAGVGLALAHIVSFVVATITNYVLNSRWAFREATGGHAGWTAYTRFITVALLAMLLRGGVLGLLTIQLELPVQLALIGAVVAAAVVNYVGCAFFVFPLQRKRSPRVRWNVAALGLILYSLLLRLVYLGLPDLIPEEAYYWNYSQHPALSYLDHPPMGAWLISLGTSVFGNTELGVRAGAMLCWVVAAMFLYGLARNLFDRSVAIRSVLLISVLPFFFMSGVLATPDAPLMAFWAGALYFLERSLVAGHRAAWWGVGLCAGCGMLSKYTFALLGIASLAYILVDKRSRRWLLRPEPYAGLILALLIFSPVVLWNAANDWASFEFQTVRRVAESQTHFSLHLLIGSAIVLLTPIGFVGAFIALLRRSDVEQSSSHAVHVDRRRLFAIIFTLVPLSVFVFFSLSHPVKLNWTGPLWLAALPALAAGFTRLHPARGGVLAALGRGAWNPTFTGTLLIFGALFHYLSLGSPFPQFWSDTSYPVAWEEFGDAVEELEDGIADRQGSKPLVVGMDKYNIASELAFYRRHEDEGWHETSSRNIFGRNGLMYAYWYSPEDSRGRSLLLVAMKRTDLADAKVLPWVENATPIRDQAFKKNGAEIGRFYYRVCNTYQLAAHSERDD